MFIRNAAKNAISKFKADFDEVDFFPSPTLQSDRLSSQTTFNDGSRFRTSSDAVLQNLASKDDLPVIPSDDEDEDDSNGQLQKRNLFQSLQHNTSSLSIKSGTSSRAQSDSSKLNTNNKPRDSISSNNSTVLSTYSNHPEQNPFKAKTLPPASDPKRDELAKKMISAIFRPMKLKGTNHDTTNEPATIPKSPVDFPSVTSSSKTTNGNGVPSTPQVKEMPESLSSSTSDSAEVVVYPKEHFSSTSVSQTSHSHDDSVISQRLLGTTEITVSHNTDSGMLTFTNDDIRHKVTTEEPNNVVVAEPVDKIDNLDDQQNTPETNDLPDTSPITQPPPLTSTKLLQGDIAVVREISVPGDFVSDEPSTSPNFQSPPLYSTTTDSNPISPKANSPVRKVEARRKPDINSFLLNLVNPQVVSKEVPEKVQPPKTQPWRPPMRSLQRISESSDSLPSDDFTPAPDGTLARKMEELGRLRRMESRNLMAKSKTSPETLPSPTTATPKAELRPQLQTLQEDDTSDVSTLLREAYVERQQALQTQLNKALAELRDVQAENKRLTSENQSQQRSISRLKIAVDEAKHEQDNSLIQINNQLRVATTSLTLLNKEKKGWQDKLDSMQHKVNASERRIRCLDHLTRHKLESRQEAGYGQPKRRGPSGSIPASTDVIGAMRALNEEIFQTCVQFVEGLERTVAVVFSSQPKPQAQKVLGVHLTEMMEDQAKKATSGGYNMLLMQTVLEVFMTHWCSLIIEAFYPPQESFADLLVQLSAQTTRNSGLAICGKQIKIIQSSTHHNNVKFNEWVKDIITDLGLFLTVAGVRMKTQSATLFSTKTLALVKVAYDLRTAMAEKDICGGLEIVIVPPDTPFQEKWMINAHADPRKVNTDQSRVDYVAGTTGIGLQCKVSEIVDGQFQSRIKTELKPKVTLAQL